MCRFAVICNFYFIHHTAVGIIDLQHPPVGSTFMSNRNALAGRIWPKVKPIAIANEVADANVDAVFYAMPIGISPDGQRQSDVVYAGTVLAFAP